MKKSYALLIFFLCLAGFAACGQKEEQNENQCLVYYVSSSETRVEAHPYTMITTTQKEQIQELITCLSTMPEKLEYKAPFAMSFKLQDVDIEDGRVMLDMDRAYNSLPATTEVLVRAAIVRTLTQVENIRYVGITVEGAPFYDNAGELVTWMNAEQFINNDGNEINTYEMIKVKLYFANEDGDKLIAAYREKHYSTNTPLERFVVEELIAGPSGQVQGIYPTINPETRINNVMTRDGICYVNLDSSFLTVENNVATEVAVYSIVNSLAELNNINKVQILINGEVPPVFTTNTFERNLDYVTTLEP